MKDKDALRYEKGLLKLYRKFFEYDLWQARQDLERELSDKKEKEKTARTVNKVKGKGE